MWPLFFIILTLCGCSKKPEEKAKLALAIRATPQTYIQKSLFYGEVQAKESSPLVVQTEGILEWLAQPGDSVEKSIAIAKITKPEIEKAYTLAANAESIANQQYARSSALTKSHSASKQQLQEREQAWIKAKLDLAKAEQELKKVQFTASFDGIVGPQLMHAGTHAKRGDIVGHFFNPKNIMVEVQIPVAYKKSLKKGQTAIIGGKKYILPHVPKMLNPETHMMVIHIPIENSSLLIGEIIDVDIYLKEWKKAILLPLGAIKFEGEAASVLVCADGKLEKREVTLDVKEAKKVVVSSGIKSGETICLDPAHYYEGDKIIPEYPPEL